MSDTSASKSRLRYRLRAARREICSTRRSAAAEAACKHIHELPSWPTAQRVALYIAADGELDTRPTVNVLLSPRWVEVRAVLLDALAPFPEARTSAAAALLEIGGNGHHSR